jgi:2-dehydro-3-deoxyglucarate aldolase/4-hydroxy-2-oxoheptanedioate aldolase
MRPNPVKRALKAGGISLGTMVFEFASTGIAQIAARAGAEFVLFDMEHTGWTIESIRTLISTTKAASIVPLVRVPATEYHFIARVLDVGAMGLMVPMVENAEQAAVIVRAAKYPPEGRRGAAFGVAHDDYSAGNIVDNMRSANEEGLLIAQIETARGLENVDAIAATPGIDVLWIGLFDLTNFLGIPGQMSHARVDEAVSATLAAVKRHGKAAGILVFSVEEGKQRLAQGFRCVAYGGDIGLYQRALAQGIKALREP